jgi:hypothetical protein
MVRKWVVTAAVAAVALGLAGCSSDGGSASDFKLPKFARKDWTAAGLTTAKATTDAVVAAMPGQCADAAVSPFGDIAAAMEAVHSKVLPTAQMTCDVNDEVVEVTVFANRRDRDQFVADRSQGLCGLAKAQAVKYKSRLTFPGLRWAVGAGNVTLQPDSEMIARRLSAITGGEYEPRGCAKGITTDWDSRAITALDALGKRIADSGHGCPQVNLIPRESLDVTRKLTNAQLPAALGGCPFDGAQIELITYDHTSPQVEKFVAGRVRSACVGDPAIGHIDGDGFTVLAPGTIAEQVHAVVGGTLAPTSCG